MIFYNVVFAVCTFSLCGCALLGCLIVLLMPIAWLSGSDLIELIVEGLMWIGLILGFISLLTMIFLWLADVFFGIPYPIHP